MRPVPEGYERRDAPGARGFAVGAAADWLQGVLSGGRTLYAWAEGQPDTRTLQGRGRVFSVPAPVHGPDGRERWAVRRYRRGGAIAPLLEDRYLRVHTTRPEVEVRASARARARGVPTPAVIAGAWYAAGPFYRADLVTELVPGAASLAGVLFAGRRDETGGRALASAGALVRESGARGLSHPDLNAMNVLVERAGEEFRTHVVDLDRATVHEVPSSALGPSMLRRLERSLRKLGRASGQPLTDTEWGALRAGFEGRT